MAVEKIWLPIGKAAAADSGHPTGEFSGYASTWGNVDSQDEVVRQGAFVRSLERWHSEGRRIPVVTDHQHDVSAVVGSLATAREDSYGLFVHGIFSGTTAAQDVRQKLVEGHLSGLSVFGGIVSSGSEKVGGRTVRALYEVDLLEVTLTPWPANTLALVSSAKANENARMDRLIAELESELAAGRRRPRVFDADSSAGRYALGILRQASSFDEAVSELEAKYAGPFDREAMLEALQGKGSGEVRWQR